VNFSGPAEEIPRPRDLNLIGNLLADA